MSDDSGPRDGDTAINSGSGAHGRKKRKAPPLAWKKGQSGNPKGRPPATPEEREVRDLARQKSLGALERLDQIGKGKGAPAVRANEAILARAFGHPRQDVAVEHGGHVATTSTTRLDLKGCTDDELATLARIAARTARTPGDPEPGGDPGGAGPAGD